MDPLPKIQPCLWFDDQAEVAARHYVAAFDGATQGEISHYPPETAQIAGRPAGSVQTAGFRLPGLAAVGLNGGPIFTPTPAVSMFVTCDDAAETDRLFQALSAGGQVLMPLQDYPFSPRYAWVQDRWGFSWQICLPGEDSISGRQKVVPCLMFTGAVYGRAEEAMRFYASLLPDSGIAAIRRWGAGEAPDVEGMVKQARFALGGQEFRAMESAHPHGFGFTEAFSFQLFCDSQAEIDRLWDALSEGGPPGAQQCGWLKDRFGLSWQVLPRRLIEMLRDPDPVRVSRVTAAFLEMGKLDLAALDRAYAGATA